MKIIQKLLVHLDLALEILMHSNSKATPKWPANSGVSEKF